MRGGVGVRLSVRVSVEMRVGARVRPRGDIERSECDVRGER